MIHSQAVTGGFEQHEGCRPEFDELLNAGRCEFTPRIGGSELRPADSIEHRTRAAPDKS